MPLAANCCVALAKSFTLLKDHTAKNNIKNNSKITARSRHRKSPSLTSVEKRFNPEYWAHPAFYPAVILFDGRYA
jgi:hypothetical protein